MKPKIDLKDTTFLFPVRLDSINRLENILMVVNSISKKMDTNIKILEASSYNNNVLEQLIGNLSDFLFVQDHDPIFHRTKYINQLVKHCPTPFIAVWDADVIIDPRQIVESVTLLRNGEASFIFPYSDYFLDTSFILRELFLKTGEIELLHTNSGKMKPLYQPDPVGGAFFAIKDHYIQSGMENENFYGWGREDGERILRWDILGYTYKRVQGVLFHLTHGRGINSNFHSDQQSLIKWEEILRIKSMSKDELLEEIVSWQI